MDEDLLSWLLLVPGITRQQAELLAARFGSAGALRAATVHDLVSAGIDEPLARRILDFAETAAPGADRLYPPDAGLYLCPDCGALIGRDVAKCPSCGAEFAAGEEEAGPGAPVSPGPPAERLQAQGQALNLCPSCGAFVSEEATACPSCGTVLEGEAEAAAEIPAPAAEPPAGGEEGLFLCPECGAIVSAGATACPRCGTSLEGQEEAPPAEAGEVAELPPEALTGEGSLFVCTNCGAFLRAEDTKCPSCGVEFEEGAVAEAAPSAEAEAGTFFPICPNCGALVPSAAKKCAICGHRMGEPAPEKAPPAETELGITKDFLERWRRVAEEKALTPERKLLRELEQYDSILLADPTVQRAWLKKAGILVQLGRLKEAAECYAKLAELNPGKEEEYRLEVLNFLRTPADRAFLPPRWSGVPATLPSRELPPPPKVAEGLPVAPEGTAQISEALDFYERLLQVDPGLAVAWQTKAELLVRLGRAEEAATAQRRADALLRGPEVGRRTEAPRVAPRLEGRVNGLGRTNGRINGTGRVNGTGRINGIGRVNGTGRINGIGRVNGTGRINGTGRVNGRGRTNGAMVPAGRVNGMVSGMAPGEGMVNGLVNGNGLTNGRRGRWAPPQAESPRTWMRSVVGIAAAALLLLMMPILATLLSTSPPPGGIEIDGEFRDWAGVPGYVDPVADLPANPDVDLRGFRVAYADGALLLYANVTGSLFSTVAGHGDSVYAFVDEDGVAATGFQVRGIGAERAIEMYGWDHLLQGTTVWVYNADRAGPASDDWRSFDRLFGATAAATRGEVEARAEVGRQFAGPAARILFHTMDGSGNGDAAEGVVPPASDEAGTLTSTGALAVVQDTLAGPVVSGPQVPVLRFEVRPLGRAVEVDNVTISKLGSIADASVTATLYRDADGDRAFDATDAVLDTQPFAPRATFAVGRAVVAPETYFVVANLLSPAANASLGFRVASVQPTVASVPVSLRDGVLTMSYVDGAPANATVDGAFADWDRYALTPDADNDVRTLEQDTTMNENIDLREQGAVVGADVAVYLRVDGRMFGGVDIPTLRDRIDPVPERLDSDRDSVPDDVEGQIDPALAHDFNNDNISDLDQWLDVDQDSVRDYDKCPDEDCSAYADYFLETTIPLWFPAPYGGRVFRAYVGPITLPPERGVDTALVYVDRDNRTDTGLYVISDGRPYGMDFVYQARGRGGRVVESGLFAHNASLPIPWERVADAETAVDAWRLEATLEGAALNLTANRSFVFYTTDWRSNSDHGDAPGAIRRAPGFGTRSPSGNEVVINEVSAAPNPEWIELANPSSSSVNLNGWVLQRKQGNNWNTFYTFTQTIGAWGSGSEYLTADFSPNTLPNGQKEVRLVAANGTEVDRTTYSSSSGQTWARFKHPTTGKPMDSDVDGSDFYVDATPTKGGPNTRHRPQIVVAKIANRASAAPGDLIVYTVYYNNTDTGRANHVWVNDTLPSDVAYVSASAAYDSTDGKVYRWHFTNVGPLTPNSFTITVRVNATAGNSQVLRNAAGLNYTDQLNRMRPASVATANTTVSRPVIVVEKVVDKANAVPGDTLTYTVYYNNTGGAVANHVWINDTLPVGVTYQGANPAPDQVNGQTLSWHFTNVAVGNHSLTITVTVDAFPPTVLVNWAFLNYTAQNDYKLGGSQDSAVTMIPEFETLLLPIAIPLVLYAWRRRKKRG